jgi:uncharacterized protein (UPF0332 family)
LLLKAGRSFDAAESLLYDGYADFAASRSYYGSFYVAEALLLSEGQSYSRHSQVVAQYGRRFAKTFKMDQGYHRLLIESFELRQTADYSTSPEAVGPEDAQHTIAEGRRFLAAAREYLGRPPG